MHLKPGNLAGKRGKWRIAVAGPGVHMDTTHTLRAAMKNGKKWDNQYIEC